MNDKQINATSQWFTYFATYGRGTIEFVKNDLLSLNTDNNNNIEILNYVEGKISFKSKFKPNYIVENLKTVERLFSSIYFQVFDRNQKQVHSLDDLLGLISFHKFNDYFDISNTENKATDIDCVVHKKPRTLIKYRINTKITGRLRQNIPYNQSITNRLVKKFEIENPNSSSYEYDVSGQDLEIILHISDTCIAFGIQLTSKPLSVRNFIKHVGLRSTICAIMIQLADIHKIPYSIIYDPFCGKGTIFTEFIGNNKSLSNMFNFLMSDMSNEQLYMSSENMKNLNTDSKVDMLCFDYALGSVFPFRSNIIDTIITDLPFGKKHKRQHLNKNQAIDFIQTFYRNILHEFNRLLVKENGILVLLVNSNETCEFESEVQNLNSTVRLLEIVEKHPLSLGETNATVYKLVSSIL